MGEPSQQFRAFTRALVSVETELTSGPQVVTGTVRNISLKGLYFMPSKWLPLGTECDVTIRFGAGDEAERITASARVVRSDRFGLGVEFTDIDLDSFHHLQNLIRYNAPDVERVEREFSDHIGLKPRA